MTNANNNWGGPRKGAGRPALKNKKHSVTVRLTAKCLSMIDRMRKTMSRGDFIESILQNNKKTISRQHEKKKKNQKTK